MLDNFSAWGLRKYINQARKILDRNWTGHYTKPSPSLYPHQWNWDSGFIAIGYAHYNETRAMQELCSLFENQWENGMVPQIVFNPEALGNYFPEPDFWQVPDGRLTSGITMPPLHAIACLHIYQHASNRDRAHEFLQEMFPELFESHRYFYRYRDPRKSGLVYIRHPWESGLDNSPNWDVPLRNIEVGSFPRLRRPASCPSSPWRPPRPRQMHYTSGSIRFPSVLCTRGTASAFQISICSTRISIPGTTGGDRCG